VREDLLDHWLLHDRRDDLQLAAAVGAVRQKTVAFDDTGKVVLPQGAIGFRWGPKGRADEGQWNLEAKEACHGNAVKLQLSVLEGADPSADTARVGFPYFGGIVSQNFPNNVEDRKFNLDSSVSHSARRLEPAWIWAARPVFGQR
jgi:nitrate reductase alpha subunit